jgi:diketogulonate reductase-like aldo/keto reductase
LHVEHQSVRKARFVYGTAWKEAETERLTTLALEAGFRGIDTANQRKHYHEAGVGAAVSAAIAAGKVTRDELFIQTKFTSVGGQDHRLPYDANADAATQVAQSFSRSLEHLETDHIDSYVLHGPSTRTGLGAYDKDVWRAMEAIAVSGKAAALGVSNVDLDQLERLCAHARIQPTFVQNRCYARTRWDGSIRAFCRERGIVYQGFSLLTANHSELRQPKLQALAARLRCTPAQLVFRFALQVGMQPLTGTTNVAHMREDLASLAPGIGALTDAEAALIEDISDA